MKVSARYFRAAGLFAAAFLASTALGKPPELPGEPVEFKVPPLQVQDFFQPDNPSAAPSDETPAAVEPKPAHGADAAGPRCALMLFTGGLSTHVETPDTHIETLEKGWSIKQLYEMLMPHGSTKDYHEAGRCTRP
jgi:hypothetical protein